MIRVFLSRLTIADLFFFPGLLFFIRFWVNPSSLYCYPGFFNNIMVETYAPWFITDAPQYPGRVTDLIVSFLTPLLSSAWGGAVMITLFAFVMCWFLGQFLEDIGAQDLLELKFIPGILVLFQCAFIENPFPAGVSIILGLLFAWLYQLSGRLVSWQRGVIFVVFAAAVYSVAIKSFIIFVALCMIIEWSVKRNLLGVCITAGVSVCIPLAVSGPFFRLFSFSDAYAQLFPGLPSRRSVTELLQFVFWAAPLCIAIIAAFHGPLSRLAALIKLKNSWTVLLLRHRTFRGIFTSVLIVLFIAGALWMCRGTISRTRPGMVMNQAMLSMNWDRLLNEAGKVPKRCLTLYHINAIDRALYYQGRLLEDLFRFPQDRNTLLFSPFAKSTNRIDRFQRLAWGAWTWFDLGLVNIAEHCALEAVALCYYPQGLQLLSKIYFVKNMPRAGRTCLTALYKDPGFRKWAERCLDSLPADSTLSFIPDVRNIRSAAIKSEFILSDIPPLAALVQENPANRMALEYLIAWNLIQRDIDSMAKYAGMLREMNYPKLPLLVEEALLLSGAFEKESPELFGYTPSREAAASFSRFYTILFTNHNGKAAEALNDLAESCGYSYFFYYMYGFSKGIIDERE